MPATDGVGVFTTLVDGLDCTATRNADVPRNDARSVTFMVDYTKGSESGLHTKVFYSYDNGSVWSELVNEHNTTTAYAASEKIAVLVKDLPYSVTDVRLACIPASSGNGTVTVTARSDHAQRPINS